MIAVAFAVPHESRDLRGTLRHATRVGSRGWLLGNIGLEEVLLAHTGIGLAAAADTAAALLAEFRPRWLLTAGYAGGLDPRLLLGDVVVATNFSSPELLARCRARRVRLITAAHALETVHEKTTLGRETGAHAVDMETSAIVRVCAARGVPVLAMRAISDAAGMRIPVPLEISFDLAKQRPRVGALLAFLARNPRLILPFGEFVTGLAKARAALTAAISQTLAEDGANPSRKALIGS